MEALILLAVFVSTLSLLVGTYLFWNRRALAAAEMARARLRAADDFVSPTGARTILKDTAVSQVRLLNQLLTGRHFTESLIRRLGHAGVDMRPGTFLLMSLMAGMVAILGLVLLNAGIASLLGAAVGLVPPVWLRWRERRRLARFQAQLPDAIDMLVSAMRAGYSFQAAMNFIGQEIADPLGPEFARFYEEQRLGMDVRTALTALQERVPSMDLKLFVTAVLVQRESGGNLGEVLANISDIMRERLSLEGEIETLTAESRISARFLTALPIIVFVVLTALNPAFMRPMIVQPTGRFLLLGAALSVTAGYVIMSRIARVDL